ncbi:MAG: FixH family protein [Acidobacteriota bacterium]
MCTRVIYTALAVVVMLALSACGRGSSDVSNLKPIEQQRVGEYTVAVLDETGQLKQGKESFVLEFRRAEDNQRVNVENVQASLSMPMSGMPTMMSETSVKPTDTPGLYKVDSNISMAGSWQLNVKFKEGQQARFTLRAA